MANATLTLKSATAHTLVYEYSNPGGGSSTVSITQAQLEIDAATAPGPSPLLALFQSITVDADWTNLMYDSRMRLQVLMEDNNNTGVDIQAVFNGAARTLRLVGVDADESLARVEVHFRHTIER